MVTRAELRARARKGLKGYFLYGILAMIIFGVLTGFVNVIVFVISGFLGLIPIIGKIASAIEIIATAFFTTVMVTGYSRYVILSQRARSSAGIGEIFSMFRGDRYRYVAETQFMWYSVIGMWSALFCIPGIMKTYEYFMVPFWLSEYPDYDERELFKRSRQIMDGHKMEAFLLDLSHIGWILLGCLPCFLGVPVALMYMNASRTELYFHLMDEYLKTPDGRAFGAYLGAAPFAAPAFRPETPGQIPAVAAPAALSGSTGRKAYLVGTQGAFAGANVPVGVGEEIFIGSDASRCSLVIQGADVSPVHLKVTFNGNVFVVTDYSSAGTNNLQGGKLPKNQPTALQPGTYLQIGAGGDIFSLECK